MDVRLVGRRDLEVVRGTVRRIAGVLARLGEDRVVGAREGEQTAAGQRPRVRLHLQVPLVHEPVADVDDQGDEEHEHGQAERDDHQDTATLVADPPHGYEHPAP